MAFPTSAVSLRQWWATYATRQTQITTDAQTQQTLPFQPQTIAPPSARTPEAYTACFYQSPSSEFFWAIQQQGNRIWTESAKTGFYGSVLQRDCSTEQEAINDCLTLCEMKEAEGWSLHEDPRKSHPGTSSTVDDRWLVLPPPSGTASSYDAYMIDPLSRYCHLSICGRNCTFMMYESNATNTWRQWWHAAQQMYNDVNTFQQQQIQQYGYVKREYPYPQKYGGMWLNECRCDHEPARNIEHDTKHSQTSNTNMHVSCGSRDTCRYLSHQLHARLYHPSISLPDFPFIQAHAVNPLLRLAWARYEWIMRRALSKSSVLKPFVNEIMELCGMAPETQPKRSYGLVTYNMPALASIHSNDTSSMRLAWKPVRMAAEQVPSGYCTKAGGIPHLPANTPYPTCPHCSSPLLLLFQLSIGELPVPLSGSYVIGEDDELIQLFVCGASGTCGQSGKVMDDYYYEGRLVKLQRPQQQQTMPPTIPSAIAGLADWDEYFLTWSPPCAEVPMIQMDPSFPSLHVSDDGNDESGLESDYNICPDYSDKLGGFPYYAVQKRQSVVIPTCRLCSHAMRYLLQVGSDCTFSLIDMGNGGTGHLYQCAQHREQLAFEWYSRHLG